MNAQPGVLGQAAAADVAPILATRSQRNRWVEALRIAAAFGIVWYHSAYAVGHDVAYAGLAAFIALSGYFAVRREGRVGVATTARRLLLPWAFWFAFYAALNLAQGQAMLRLHSVAGVLYGPSPHLWFLPYIFVATLVIHFTRARVAYPAVFALGLILVTASVWRLAADRAGPPAAQYVHALAPLLFGVLLGQRHPAWRVAAYAAVIGMAYTINLRGIGTPYLLGAMAVLGAVDLASLDSSRLRAVDRIAPLMFGVYLMHPFFLGVMRLGHVEGVARVVGAFLFSIGTTWFARRHRVGRAIT